MPYRIFSKTQVLTSVAFAMCRRREDDQAGKNKKGGRARAAPVAAAPVAAPAPAPTPAQAVQPSGASGSSASGWVKLPKKGKGKKKGQKIDNAMLGFETNTNYNLLERPDL